MEPWIESMGQSPQSISLIMVVIVCIVAVLMLYTVSRMVSGRKDLDKERRALDAELYGLEKFASQKKKERDGPASSRPESFWPRGDSLEATSSKQPAAAREQSVQPAETEPQRAQSGHEEEDGFADIREENIVKDWNG